MAGQRLRLLLTLLLFTLTAASAPALLADEREPEPEIIAVAPSPVAPSPAAPDTAASAVCPTPTARALLAGDSWAQYMWDDSSHNDLLDKFGHADKRALSESLGEDPGPGYSGSEYAISGSEARQWADTANYPWIANMVAALQANPDVDTLVLSIGGNDILAGKSGGGWYKDMDLDAPGSEEALFARIEADTWQIINAALAVRPDIEVIISGYDYPNFNVNIFFCWLYACPKREDLSRDPDNDLITDEEINAMMVDVEGRRIGWANSSARVPYDHTMGLMHYFYGDTAGNGPGALPYPGQTPPDYAPFPGGNPPSPSPRSVFRSVADPIHLSYDGYQYKITNQIEAYFFPRYRGEPGDPLFSQGGANDGWTDGESVSTDGVFIGDADNKPAYGIVSFDTAALPDDAVITGASLYLLRASQTGANPFTSGQLGRLTVDVARGSFGDPAVEASDANAPADASDAGCVYGTAKANYYAIRADITAGGLAAINPSGLTQFRFAFSNADAGQDGVTFYGGDAVLSAAPPLTTQTITTTVSTVEGAIITVVEEIQAITHRGLADTLGTAVPFLDLTYCTPPAAPQTTIALTGEGVTLNWTAVSGAEAYEVWWGVNDPYVTAGASCAAAANCALVEATSYSSPLGVGNAGENVSYRVRAVNSCGGTAVSVPSDPVAEFDFVLQVGE